MAELFNMPPMGQTSSTLKIIQWRVQEGDVVAQGDILVEVETDKATLDVESYASGTVLKILRAEGDSVEVGEAIAVIGEPGDQIDLLPEKSSPEVVHDVAASKSPEVEKSHPVASGKILAAPAVRKLAVDRGIELSQINGSGPGGRITKDDVMNFTAGPSREVVARRVAASFSTIPHIYLSSAVDMSSAALTLENARSRSPDGAANPVGSASPSGEPTRITYTHLILRAVGAALSGNGRMNAVWNDGGVPRDLGRKSVGLVVSGGAQLAIVCIDEPGSKSVEEIAPIVAGAATRARSGQLNASDVAPCAVSVSNLGMYDVDEFLAIIDPDQCAMISVGRIQDRIVAVEGNAVVRPMMSVSIAADHRVVDGTDAAQFLQDIKQRLESAE